MDCAARPPTASLSKDKRRPMYRPCVECVGAPAWNTPRWALHHAERGVVVGDDDFHWLVRVSDKRVMLAQPSEPRRLSRATWVQVECCAGHSLNQVEVLRRIWMTQTGGVRLTINGMPICRHFSLKFFKDI